MQHVVSQQFCWPRTQSPSIVVCSNHSNVDDVRMFEQSNLEICWVDVLTAADDHVLQTPITHT